MYVQDASVALPVEKRQVFDALVAEAAAIIRARQSSLSDQARKPVGERKPFSDRMTVVD